MHNPRVINWQVTEYVFNKVDKEPLDECSKSFVIRKLLKDLTKKMSDRKVSLVWDDNIKYQLVDIKDYDFAMEIEQILIKANK